MSTDGPTPAEFLAVAFLVEASLSLSYEWKRLFQDYIVQILQRCNISPGTNKTARIAFITYGTADTQPSPIVQKIYFTELRYIIQDIKDDSRRLGIGQTDSGGSKGMAALEGFAAALDMFDFLRTMGVKDPDCRLVHVAATPPNGSEHPHWNTSQSFDSLTWKLLPSELKKRNIRLTGINTSLGLPCFPELYSQAATGNPTTPWFNVKTQHYVFLDGFASTQPQPKAKRIGEPVATERTPETKRPRVAPTQSTTDKSPTPPPAQPPIPTSPTTVPNANTAQSTVQAAIQPIVQPATQPTVQPPQPTASATMPAQPQIRQIMQQVQFILSKRKQLEDEVKALMARKQSPMAQGNMELLNLCDAEITKRKEQFVRLNQALVVLQQQARRLQQPTSQNTSSQGQDAGHPNLNATQGVRTTTSPSTLPSEPQTPLNPIPTNTPRQSSNVQSPNQNPQTVSAGASGTTPSVQHPGATSPGNNLMSQLMQTPIPKPPSSSGLSAQMQKLLELRNRQTPLGAGMASSIGGQGLPGMLPAEGGTGPIVSAAQLSAQNPPQMQSLPVWGGILSFNGIGSDGNKKEVRTGVSASSSNASNSHSETWPSSLTLVPASTPSISIPEFQEWIRRTKPVLCTFKAKTPDDEPNYQMLVSVMSSKKMYATASWTLPNGILKENVLIFPFNNMGLCGAFFPLTGIPEMPKVPAPQIPPAVLNLLSQLPLEQRNIAVAQIRQKMAAGPEAATNFFRALLQRQLQQQQLQQQNAQNRAAMANQFGLNPGLAQVNAIGNNANLLNMMGMNTMNAGGANALAGLGNPSTMLPNGGRTTTGGGPGTSMDLNYDVLQSFMRRNNPDGNNGSGMGPN